MALPFLDRLQTKQPGAPQMPKVPAGPPVLSTPRPTNPPAPATGPVGRPPRPSLPFAGRAGAPLPVSPPAASPVAPSTPAPSPAPAPGPGASQPPAAGFVKPAPAPGTKPTAPVQAPAAGQVLPGIAQQLQVQMDHIPSSAELLTIPPGSTVATPYGSVDSSGKMTFSPEGQQKYKEAIVARRREFGFHPFNNDPNAPPPPAKLGKPMFNPFTGQWVK